MNTSKDMDERFCAWCGLNAEQLRKCEAPSKDGKFLLRSKRGDYSHCCWPGCVEEEEGGNEKLRVDR